MGSVILDGSHIGHHSVVAGRSVLPPEKIYPPFSMIVGNPALVKRRLTDESIVKFLK